MSIKEYMAAAVNFDVPGDALDAILASRGVDGAQAYYGATSEEGVAVDLLRADLYRWIVLGPSKITNTSESDNGWSHSGGGYTLDARDKKLLTDEANAIYKSNGEDANVFGKVRVRVRSNGIMAARYDVCGRPLPRISR